MTIEDIVQKIAPLLAHYDYRDDEPELSGRKFYEKELAELRQILLDYQESLAKSVEGKKRPTFQERTVYSEVQQEAAWYNDGIRDAAALIRSNEPMK